MSTPERVECGDSVFYRLPSGEYGPARVADVEMLCDETWIILDKRITDDSRVPAHGILAKITLDMVTRVLPVSR